MSLSFTPLIFFVYAFVGGVCSSMFGPGPIAAMVIKYCAKKQNKYAKYFALGASISESLYAGIALWGMNSFLMEWTKPIMPYAKLLAGVIAIALGYSLTIFVLTDVWDDTDKASEKPRDVQASFLLGFTISFVNVALLGTWSGICAMILSDSLRPTVLSILFFTIGAMSGIFSWFNVIIKVISIYRNKLSNQVICKAIHGLGYVLISAGCIILIIAMFF